ncbi:MAG: hypothetical protein WCL23_00315 [Candidatus Moraniibacteriota bacterium]
MTIDKHNLTDQHEPDPVTENAVRNESSYFLLLLLVSASFFGLLAFANGEAIDTGIEADIATMNTKPYVRYRSPMERELEKMVDGHPIAAMIPYISSQDPETAKYLVSIAKHESNWGTLSPKDADGQTCFNYWGYRGAGDRVTESGYSCFESPKEAIAVVGKRLDYLIWDLRLNTPEKLIVWKCGKTCAGHSSTGVRNWIDNVDYYSKKVESARLADSTVTR